MPASITVRRGKAGTRVPVSIVIGSLAGGMSLEEVMAEYELRKEQVEAALAYAAELVAHC